MVDLAKQAILINNSVLRNTHIDVYGIGSVGSHLVLGLAKLGVESISVWDYDTVNEDNISAQAFGLEHVGLKKTEALFDLVKRQTGIKIELNNLEIDEETDLEPEINSIQCSCVDSLKARKIIFDKLVGLPVYWLDSRIGGFDHQYYFLKLDDKQSTDKYIKTLKPIPGMAYELKCGEKCSIGNNLMIVSELMANIVRLINGIEPNKKYISNFLWFNNINSLPKVIKC